MPEDTCNLHKWRYSSVSMLDLTRLFPLDVEVTDEYYCYEGTNDPIGEGQRVSSPNGHYVRKIVRPKTTTPTTTPDDTDDTTEEPTTDKPTTEEPTTEEPTTDEPTTEEPTTPTEQPSEPQVQNALEQLHAWWKQLIAS